MSIMAEKPATTPIPVQLSDSEFTAFILPHLSMPKRGPKCKLGYHRVFNRILWVLYTGMQWKCLPVPTDSTGKPAIHSRPSTKSLPNGPMMGRSGKHSWPVWPISLKPRNSTSVSSMATGPTPWPKKGGWHWLLRLQTPKRGEGHRHNRQQWLCVGSSSCGTRQ